MTQAIEYLYYIFNKFNLFVFSQAQIVSGVYLGWVIMVIILFSMVMGSLLNVPRGIGKFNHSTVVRSSTYKDADGSKVTVSRRSRV